MAVAEGCSLFGTMQQILSKPWIESARTRKRMQESIAVFGLREVRDA
jgi:hypothetical protein